jgi:hypothetical protein
MLAFLEPSSYVRTWCCAGVQMVEDQAPHKRMRGETYYLLVLIVSFSHACTYGRMYVQVRTSSCLVRLSV